MGWRANPWHGSRGGHAGHVAHQVLGSPAVQHVVRHYAPTRSTTRIAHQVLGSRGVQRAARHGQVVLNRRAARVLRLSQRRLPVQATVRTPALSPTLRLATRQPSSVFTQPPVQATRVAQVPHVAIPNVFHTRIAPVSFRPAQNAAARFVERSVAKVPGRARPPVIPKLRRYTAVQQRYIDRATTQWVRRAARDRGQRSSGDVSAQIGRYGTPREKRALNTYFRGGTTAAQNAALYRRAVMQTARTRGINAAIGGPSIDFGPLGVPGYRDPRALRRLRGALQSGNQGVQAVAGRAVRQALAPPTTDAGAAWLRAANRVAAANRPGPVEKAGMFVFGPQHNPVAAATSGLYKNSAAFRDVVNLPANTVTSTYNLGAGVVEAVQGNPRRLKQIGSALRQHDPVVLAVRSLIEGNPKLLKRAAFEARTHPASTFLELSGAGHGLARGGELAARVGGGLPRTLRQDVARVAARTGRRRVLPPALARDVPYRLPDTGIQGRRPFSRHALVRVAQRDRAARNIATSNRLRSEAARAKTAATHARQRGDAAAADALSRAATDGVAKANRIDPRIASPDEVRRWLNEHNSAMEDLRRGGRPQALRASAAATKGLDKKWVPILNLHLQGAVHLSRDDLKLYRTQLEHEAAHLTGSKLQANVATRGYLTKAIEAKHFPVDEIRAAAQRYRDHIKPVQRAVVDSGMLDPAAAERAPLFGYAVRRMGAVFDHGGRISGREQLLIPDSRGGFRHVSNDEIRAHMLDPNLGGGRVNPWDVIYLPQTPEARGAINYYRDWMQRETHRVPGQGRTGDAIRQGTLDIHPDVLGAHAANLRGLLDANHAFQDFYRQFGFRGAQGTYGKMRDLARQVKAETGRNLVPVRIKPWGGSEEQLGQLLEHASQAQFDEFGNAVSPIHEAVGRALNPSAHDPGPFGLADQAAVDTMRGHMRILDPTPGKRVLQVVNQGFRRTVLPFSVRWLFGNMAEAGVRTLLQAHFNPVAIASDYTLMRRALVAHDRFVDADPSLSPVQRERAKAEVRARVVGGGHFEMQTRTMIHRTADWFMGDQSPKILRWAGRVAGTTARLPPVKLALQGLRWYTDGVLHTVNGTLERQFQTAMAGRAGRLTLIDRAMPTVSTRAAADLAQGLRGTAAQVELGRIVDRAYGKYSKFSPSLRAAVAQYTPFIAWTLNAGRFLLNVLPADHPVFTAVMAANVNAQNDWLLAHGMVPGQQGGVPDWLIGTFPGGGGHIPTSRYTPFGLMQNFPANLADLVLPQYSGFLKGLQGLDWKNQPVTGADTVEKRILLGFKQFADSNIPIYSQAQTILNRKESGLGSKVLGFINPFTPYKNTSTAGSAAGGPHDAKIDKALRNLPGAGGGQYDHKIDRALKSYEAQHIPGLGFVNPQALGGYLAGLGKASVQLDTLRRQFNQRKRQFSQQGRVHHGDALPKIAADVLRTAPQLSGNYHPGRFSTRPNDPGIRAPRNARLVSLEAQFPMGRPAGQAIGKGAFAFLNPETTVRPQPGGFLRRSPGPTQRARLFAHPQRAASRNLPGASAQLAGRKAGFAIFGAPGKPLAGRPGMLLKRFARYGVKNSGRVVVPAHEARQAIHNFSQLGYGHGQIVDFLAHGRPRKQLGVPAQVTRAMAVLKHVSTGAVVPQNKSHYSPAEISKMAQAHGAPKWLADALGRTSVSESGGNPHATSNSAGGGSRGLLQINPAAWGAVHRHGNLYNPDYNVRSALYVMSQSGSGAWSGSGTWHDKPVPAGQFKFPPPWQQKPAVKLTPHQRQAEKVARRAARAWTSAGQAPVPHKVPAQIRAMLGHIPTQRAKGGPSLKELPRPVRRFLKRYLPQPVAAPGVSSPSNTSGIPVSTSQPGVSAGVASGKASGGKASGLSGLPAADAAALAQLLAPQQGPVLATPLQAPAFSAGAVFPSGYTAGQVSLADILQRITGRARV